MARSSTAEMEAMFNQDAFYNDVEVRIEVAQASASAGPQQRKTVFTSSADLVGHSPRFKAELERWQPATSAATASTTTCSSKPPKGKKQKLGDTPDPSSSSRRRVVHVGVEDEACAEAVETCLRFVYVRTGKLAAGLSVPQLGAIFRMANGLALADCTQATAGALKALKPADLSVEDAVALGYGAILPESAHTAELQALCLAALLHHLGDVVVVMRSEALQALWYALPFAALLDLVRSKKLATDSEDSVVTACSLWVERKADAERSKRRSASAQSGYISTAQRQQLLDALRLLQLSSMYYHTVLPALRWAQPVLSAATLLWLAGYAGADVHAKDTLQAHGQGLPAAWTNAVPRPRYSIRHRRFSAISVLHVTVATRQQLLDEALPGLRANVAAAQQQGQAADAAAPTVLLPAAEVFAHGFKASVFAQLSIKKGLGVFVKASLPFELMSDLRSSNTLMPAWRLSYRIHGQKAGDGPDTYSRAGEWVDWGNAFGGWGVGFPSWIQFPARRPITEIASWDALALVGGQLRLEVEVRASAQRLLAAAAPAPAAAAAPRGRLFGLVAY